MEGNPVLFLHKQESRFLLPLESLSPSLAFGQDGLSTAGGEAICFIPLQCYLGMTKGVPIGLSRASFSLSDGSAG